MLRQASAIRGDRRIRRSAPLVCFALGVLLTTALACGRVSATREFNHGIRYYNEENYPAAVRAFERASQSLPHREVRYNLALARFKALKTASEPSPADTRAALEAVTHALKAERVDDPMQARLHYIAGSIHHLTGDEKRARAAFAEALAHQDDYAPALRALVKLDTPEDSPLARFVLAVSEVEEPTLEDKLPL